jgi:cytoskeletal protein RodZ
MKIGDILKQARTEKGLSLSQVAKEIYVHEKFLRALEEGDYDAIPGEAYQRAYFRSYAGYLGLTEYIDNIAKPHKFTQAEEDQSDGNILGGSWDSARITRVSIRFGLIIIAILLIVVAVKAAHRAPGPVSKDKRVPSTQQGIVVVPIEPEPVWNTTGGDTSGDAALSQPGNTHELKLEAREACWVVVKTREGTSLARMMRPGEKLTYTDLVGFYVKAGLPEKLDVTFDGKKIKWEEGQKELILPIGAAVIPTDDKSGQKSTSND